MKKKVISALLSALLIIALLPCAAYADSTYIIGDGVTVPNPSAPADGSNPYCNCGGTVGYGHHRCCWNYSAYVYLHVWGEAFNTGDSSCNYLRNVDAADRILTADNLKKYLTDAAPGAVLRLDGNSVPGSGDSYGHSLVFVAMDPSGDGAWFLEGNYNGRGNSRLIMFSFNALAGQYGYQYKYIKYIMWPNAPDFTADPDDSSGYVAESFPSRCRISISAETMLKSIPCSSSHNTHAADIELAASGSEYHSVGLFKTTDGELWYKVEAKNGSLAYLPAASTLFVEQLTDDVSLNGFTPPEFLKHGSPFGLTGSISTKYQRIERVDAKVKNSSGSTLLSGYDSPGTVSYSLPNSTVDKLLSFGSLYFGNYIFSMEATVKSYYAKSSTEYDVCSRGLTLHENPFSVVLFTGCSHSFTQKVTKPAGCDEEGEMSYRCGKCYYTYTQPIEKLGHSPVSDPAVSPDCVNDGKTEGSHCGVCSAVLVPQHTIPAGHSYSDHLDSSCNICGHERKINSQRPTVNMYRMYDPNSGEHFYTGSDAERNNLIAAGWDYEGVGFTFPLASGKPVYRLYEPSSGEHLYTMDEGEKATLMSQGWNYEGVAFNSAEETEVPQYRLHNPNAARGAYHFTASTEERDYLISLGWESQGIGWYSCWK